LAQRKATFLPALILMASPVAGLRPARRRCDAKLELEKRAGPNHSVRMTTNDWKKILISVAITEAIITVILFVISHHMAINI
jgi:hypothetical protein